MTRSRREIEMSTYLPFPCGRAWNREPSNQLFVCMQCSAMHSAPRLRAFQWGNIHEYRGLTCETGDAKCEFGTLLIQAPRRWLWWYSAPTTLWQHNALNASMSLPQIIGYSLLTLAVWKLVQRRSRKTTALNVAGPQKDHWLTGTLEVKFQAWDAHVYKYRKPEVNVPGWFRTLSGGRRRLWRSC